MDILANLTGPLIGLSVVSVLGLFMAFAQLYQGSQPQHPPPSLGCTTALFICGGILLAALILATVTKFLFAPFVGLPFIMWLINDESSFGNTFWFWVIIIMLTVTFILVWKGQKNRENK